MLEEPTRKLGVAVVVVAAALIQFSILAGLVFETVWTIRELGWWWAIAIHAGIFVFAAVIIWQLLGGWVLDHWDTWRYARNPHKQIDARIASEAQKIPPEMSPRGSFSALVDAERSVRSTRG